MLGLFLLPTLWMLPVYAQDWENTPPTELGILPSEEGYVASKLTGRLIGTPPELNVCFTGELKVGGRLTLNPRLSDADEDLIKHDDDTKSIEPGGTRSSVRWFRIVDGSRTQIAEEDYELVLTQADLNDGVSIEFEIQPFTVTGYPDYNPAVLIGSFNPSDADSLNKQWSLSATGETSVTNLVNECGKVIVPIRQPVVLDALITVKQDDEYIPVLRQDQNIPSTHYNEVAVDITKASTLDLPATGGRTYYIRFYENNDDVTDTYAIANVNDSAEFAAAKENFVKHIKWQLVYEKGEIANVVFNRNDLSFTTQVTNDDKYKIYRNFDPNRIQNGIDTNQTIEIDSTGNKRQQKSRMQVEYDDALLIKVSE